MKSKVDVVIGMLIGVALGFLGMFLFITFATDYSFFFGLESLIRNGSLNKIVALGEILNIPVFYLLLNKEEYFKARGVLLQALIITIVTLFI